MSRIKDKVVGRAPKDICTNYVEQFISIGNCECMRCKIEGKLAAKMKS